MPSLLLALLLSTQSVADNPTFGSAEVRQVGSGVTEPLPESQPSPTYPAQARSERLEGNVLLEAIITKSGLVADCRVLRSVDPALDAAAIEAVRQWRYKPAVLDGRPVPVYLTVTVRFAFPDSPKPRPEESLLGIWKVRGSREWLVVWPSGEAYRCSVVSAGNTISSPGSVNGKVVIWNSHWPSQSLSRAAQQLIVTGTDSAVVFDATEILPAESCLPERRR